MSTAPPPLDQLSHADAHDAVLALLCADAKMLYRDSRPFAGLGSGDWRGNAADTTYGVVHTLMKRLYAMDLLWWRKCDGALQAELSEAGVALLPELRIWVSLVGDAISELDRNSEEERTSVFTSGSLTKAQLKER